MTERTDGQDAGVDADELRRLNGITNRQSEAELLQGAVRSHISRIMEISEINGASRALRAVAADPATGWAIGTFLRAVADLVETGVCVEHAIVTQNILARRGEVAAP